MTVDVLGGCRCGRVRYSGTHADVRDYRCQCRDCQRLTGTGHADLLPIDAASAQPWDGGVITPET